MERFFEFQRFRLIKCETKCLECKFNEGDGETVQNIVIGDIVAPKVENFRYLDSVIQGIKRLTRTLVIGKGVGKNRGMHLEHCVIRRS